MIVTARRLRSMGWIATLVVCAALVMVLAFRVNALRSQVHQSNARIIALKQETIYLETEFETRANQQQLKAWNDVEFGYVAPTAAQYLDNERQLAAYSKPLEPGAPTPIRVASADDGTSPPPFPAMVSPMTGKPVTGASDSAPATKPADDADDTAKVRPAVAAQGLAGLGDRIGTVRHVTGDAPTHKSAAGHPARTKDAKPETATARAHLASADEKPAHATDAHHRTVAGKASATPLIKLALKDAKTVK